MKLILLNTGVALALALAVFPVPQQTATPFPLGRPDGNLLSNGGFEAWTHGSSFQGPIGPDDWYAMGDLASAFTQGAIAFTRIDACPPTGNGSALMQIRANLPQNFVSQSLANFGEYAAREVTFSVDVRPLFPLASARIEVDDGVGSSSALIRVSQNDWGRVTVRHAVAKCPTKLEFRVYPEQTLEVDGAMAVVGGFDDAVFTPRGALDAAAREVPLGTVLDWFRFDPGIPVPEGFAICDGSPVVDSRSPYQGRPTPNLADRFVRGVTSAASIGSVGGADTASIAHTHPIPHVHSCDTGSAENGGPGNGYWLILQNPQGPTLLATNQGHHHQFTTGNSSNANSGQSSLSSIDTVPTYVGLLKIVRIR